MSHAYARAVMELCEAGKITPGRAAELMTDTLTLTDRRLSSKLLRCEILLRLTSILTAGTAKDISSEQCISLLCSLIDAPLNALAEDIRGQLGGRA